MYCAVWICFGILHEGGTKQILVGSRKPLPRCMEETTGMSSCNAIRDFSAVVSCQGSHSEIKEPLPERCSRYGSETTTLEVVVCVWHYTLRVVRARKEVEYEVIQESVNEFLFHCIWPRLIWEFVNEFHNNVVVSQASVLIQLAFCGNFDVDCCALKIDTAAVKVTKHSIRA